MQLFASLLLYVLVGEVICQTELTNTEKQEIINLHNNLRGTVNPTASNMQSMVWSDELAQVAQNYAEKCIFGHNSDRKSQQCTFGYVGENIAAGSGTPNYNQFVQDWYDEVTLYTYDTDSCESGKACGHYTQVVWAKSRSLGCGAYRCNQLAGISGGANWVNLVCNYGPGGNYIGQKPYMSGASCSACPSDLPYCSNNLCTDVNPSATTSNRDTIINANPPVTTSDAEVIDTTTIVNQPVTTSDAEVEVIDTTTIAVTTSDVEIIDAVANGIEAAAAAKSGGVSATLNVLLLLATSFMTIYHSITLFYI